MRYKASIDKFVNAHISAIFLVRAVRSEHVHDTEGVVVANKFIHTMLNLFNSSL